MMFKKNPASECQEVTLESCKKRQSLDIRRAFHSGHTTRIMGTETSTIRISSGRPMRQ